MAVINNKPSDPDESGWEYRSDKQAVREALDRFNTWYETGAEVFSQNDYDILFQAGAFELNRLAEQFCEAVYLHGPVPGERRSELTGEDVAPRNAATGKPDLRGSQRIVYGGNRA